MSIQTSTFLAVKNLAYTPVHTDYYFLDDPTAHSLPAHLKLEAPQAPEILKEGGTACPENILHVGKIAKCAAQTPGKI